MASSDFLGRPRLEPDLDPVLDVGALVIVPGLGLFLDPFGLPVLDMG